MTNFTIFSAKGNYFRLLSFLFNIRVKMQLLVVLTFLLSSFNSAFSQNDTPCEGAQRWTQGAHWNDDGTINDLPNAPDPVGIIRCGSSAETQSQIGPYNNSIYNPLSFLIDVSGDTCIDPSTGLVVTPLNPTDGQPIIWLNFDVRPEAGSFQIQINDNAGDNIAWALFISDEHQTGTSLAANGQQLSGDCSQLAKVACGVESSSTWNTIPINGEDFLEATNFYLAVWDQDADGEVNLNNFKARFGCGDAGFETCSLTNGTPEEVCNDDGTFTINVPIEGINGEFIGYDANANNSGGLSNIVCLTNAADGNPVTSGTISLTYNQGTSYSIEIFETTNSSPPTSVTPGESCDHPDAFPGDPNNGNADDCVVTVTGDAPDCCIPPATPVVSVKDPTCDAAGSASITNYNDALSYTFDPAGPSVDENGLITGFDFGQAYSVTASGGGDCDSDAATFNIENQLDCECKVVTPVVSVKDPTCDSAGSASITNYDDALYYTFDPAGPSVDENGNITGFEFGQAYDVTAVNGEKCYSDAATFTIEGQLDKPTVVVTKISICSDEDYVWDANGETYYGSDGDQDIWIKGGKCEADQHLIITVIPVPTIEVIDIACGEKNEIGYYSVNVLTNGGNVMSDYGTPNDNGGNSWTISNIPNGQDLVVIVMNDKKCGTSIEVKAPYCPCIEFDFDYTNVSCYGANDGTITINYVTDGSYVYVNGGLYNSEMLYAPGTYTIEVYTKDKNEDCTITEKITIEEPKALSSKITNGFIGDEPSCDQDNMLTVDASGGTGLKTYQWSLSEVSINNGWLFSENTDTTASAINFDTGLGLGEFTIKVTDENGCMTESSVAFKATCDPTKPIFVGNPQPIRVNLFPNPVRDVLNIIVTNTKDINVEVFDLLGNMVFAKSFIGNINGRSELKVDFSKFNSNLYYLKIKTDDGVKVKKVLLNK